MKVTLVESWQIQMSEEFEKPYFKELTSFLRQEYSHFDCFPPGSKIFNALDSCLFEDVRVIILGQDPYHSLGQAHGLCFSVPNGITHPPSLINIFKELQDDTYKNYPSSGSLISWVKQGVLLLNSTLTVRSGQPGSHQNRGWETFTDIIIEKLSSKKSGLVFMLWGNYAKKKGKHIDRDKHLVLESGHPSPLSANRGLWFGNKHFSRTNEYFEKNGKKLIEW